MTNYSLTKIYKIESNLGNKIYVGSTAKQYLSQRFQQHKNNYKKFKEGSGKKDILNDLFNLYGLENCKIVLLESYSCSSKDEKNAKEEQYIKDLDCINKIKLEPKMIYKNYYQKKKAETSLREYVEDQYLNGIPPKI